MKEKKQYDLSGFTRYSGLAFQMGIIIFLGTFGGIKLDELWGTSPLFVLLGSLASIALAMYTVIHDINKHNNNDKKSSN